MKLLNGKILTIAFVFAILIPNMCRFVRDGRTLDSLRDSVLRLHILAASDSGRDQQLKLMVRDELLDAHIFDGADDLSDAENIAERQLDHIVHIAEGVLRANGCSDHVSAELTDMWFDERVYGQLTMPAGYYRAVRVKIGPANGHNWWCVMYPPLCLPAACDTDSTDCDNTEVTGDVRENIAAEDAFFSSRQLDIMKKPKKYRVRFAVWDKLRGLNDDKIVRSDKNCICP